MKKLLLILVAIFCGIFLFAQEMYQYEIDEIEKELIKGVWSQDDGTLIELSELQIFSWGEGRIIPKLSRVIDEEIDGALFIDYQNEGKYEINRIVKIDDNHYLLNIAASKRSNYKNSNIFINNFPKEATIQLEIVDSNTIQFTTSNENRFFRSYIRNNFPLYRYSGLNMHN